MNAISLAFSLIRVPRLFISLLLWPLIIGLSIATLQAISSSLYFGVVTETSVQAAERLDSENPSDRWLRMQLFQTEKELPELNLWPSDKEAFCLQTQIAWWGGLLTKVCPCP